MNGKCVVVKGREKVREKVASNSLPTPIQESFSFFSDKLFGIRRRNPKRTGGDDLRRVSAATTEVALLGKLAFANNSMVPHKNVSYAIGLL